MAHSTARPAQWKILLAYATIYIVWGSTYLSIRIGVHEFPPFLMAAIRFFVAGSVLFLWLRFQGVPSPTRKEWAGAFLLGTLMFLIDYSCLFWAEQKTDSGVAAVVLATIPLFITLLEIVFLGTLRLTVRLGAGLVLGLFGVAVLTNSSTSFGAAVIDRAAALALTVASLGWSIGTIVARKLQQPASKPMGAAIQMLLGGAQIFVLSAVAGEFPRFHLEAISGNAWFALIYLIIAGSLVAYTAYVWLLHHESPTRVGTYAYVNPVVAVVIGYLFGGEHIGLRTILGTVLVLVSVVTVTTASKRILVRSAPKIEPATAAD